MLLAACSGSGSQSSSAGLPSAGASQGVNRFDPARSGVAPKFLGMVGHSHQTAQHVRGDAFAPRSIFVSDFGSGLVERLKYSNFSSLAPISSGLNGPDGNWVDRIPGNLYVANYAGPYITEYNTSGNLLYTYSNGMADPVGVTTDKNNNVYEADFNYTVSGGGYVNEYAQQSNTVIASCSPGGNVEGVAVDRHLNVFVYYNNPAGGANIIEYTHTNSGGGFANCNNSTVLPITFGFAGGMVLDKRGRLVVCDQVGTGSGPVVDVIAGPPYTSITGTLGSGYSDPFHVTIDMRNDRAYVADLGAAVVQVLAYPSGSSVATLGSANGLTSPAAAVDSKNSVINL